MNLNALGYAAFVALVVGAEAAAPPLGGRTGYLHPDGTNATGLFYWLFEATEVSPADAPLVLWLQGGPGASSLLGQFYELGPHRMEEGDTNHRCMHQDLPSEPILSTNVAVVMLMFRGGGPG